MDRGLECARRFEFLMGGKSERDLETEAMLAGRHAEFLAQRRARAQLAAMDYEAFEGKVLVRIVLRDGKVVHEAVPEEDAPPLDYALLEDNGGEIVIPHFPPLPKEGKPEEGTSDES